METITDTSLSLIARSHRPGAPHQSSRSSLVYLTELPGIIRNQGEMAFKKYTCKWRAVRGRYFCEHAPSRLAPGPPEVYSPPNPTYRGCAFRDILNNRWETQEHRGSGRTDFRMRRKQEHHQIWLKQKTKNNSGHLEENGENSRQMGKIEYK